MIEAGTGFSGKMLAKKNWRRRLIPPAAVVAGLAGPAFAASEPDQDVPADAGLGATIKKLLPVGKNGHLDAVRKALDHGDTDAALDDLRPLAEKGDTKAQVLLGDLFLKGQGVPHNYSMAWQWYQRAALAGNAQAQFKLANMYRKGLGVPYYLSKAVEWYGRAAEQDYVEAQYMLGLIHSGRFGGAWRDPRKVVQV
ncbi:MAG TPA: hypothetical protein HPP75_07700 [Rhodospirillaceae bacterium]|jgi:hypothetical protein|nr:hypothetical protein [Rhodospirillaceae bacterium]